MSSVRYKTRHQVSCNLSNFIGCGRELIPSELPTLRDILRLGLLMRDSSCEDRRNYPIDELASDIYPILINQWSKANPAFVSPILNDKKRICVRIKDAWTLATTYSQGKGKLKSKLNFNEKLDRLFDILNCKCKILSCEEQNCNGCDEKSHISCSCQREKKIPYLELSYIKDQREKIGSVGKHQMAQIDIPEVQRIKRKLERQSIAENAKEKRMKKLEESSTSINYNIISTTDEESSEAPSDVDLNFPTVTKSPSKKNYDEIRTFDTM